MKLSCNGCRILRKGCSENCIIKPCLEWINSAESQANATLFLSKYYGRTGFLNLITAAPPHLSPAVFKSLLYEACGRLVNPTYGSMGLFWTGEWAQCEAAVDAVLSGSIIDGITPYDWHSSRTFGDNHVLSTCDIRHVSKRTNMNDVRGRIGFKRMRQVVRPEPQVGSMDSALLWWKPKGESENTEPVKDSSTEQDKLNQVGKTELNLDLTLGFRCQSTCTKN